jgi:DNA-directed RNA polymerase subunit RPC12/RpoP
MIQFAVVILKEIFDQGRNFSWERPIKCPRCNHYKVWGHGHVSALFDGFTDPLWLKRYRCPSCGCLITMRPASHFSGFQSSRATIRSALQHRLKHGRWPSDLASARMRHWLTNLKRQIIAHIPHSWKPGLMVCYDNILKLGKIPVSRSI